MRLRVEARLRKAIRRAEHGLPGLQAAVARRERQGAALAEALCRLAVDPEEGWDRRWFIATLLWKTPGTEDVRHTMVGMVANTNGSLEEQISAVDVLGFVCGRPLRRALIGILNDDNARLEVRERAAEMLSVQGSREAVEACVAALDHENASIRFWAAFALGQIASFCGHALRAVAASALQRVLDDEEITPGWWSVGREAQAMIVGLRNDPGEKERLQADIRRIQQDSHASAEDRRWAECYSDCRE
jgi:hypothetical protein